jgi:hydroxyacylglutathione hydrolase
MLQMVVQTVESEGLAHLSYILADRRAGVCAVIDPRRDIDTYLNVTAAQELRITHVLETHIHADFVSGAKELAEVTGAQLCTGPGDYAFPHTPLRDGDEIEIGTIHLDAIPTPGHTPEHICLLVSVGQPRPSPVAVFTGDTLFAGEVGRPDLLGPDAAAPLAHQLFQSLHGRLMALDDTIIVYPSHGAGSPCGANIGDATVTTIGYERRANPRLRTRNEARFVQEILALQTPFPAYYPRMKRVNTMGPEPLGGIPFVRPLPPDEFQTTAADADALVVDVRQPEAFAGAHIPGALNIPLQNGFALWAGWLIGPGQKLLLVPSNPQDIDVAQRRLLRVGLCAAAYLQGGMGRWLDAGKPFETTRQMSSAELRDLLASSPDGLQLLDVRTSEEWADGHLPSAMHAFLPSLPQFCAQLDTDKPVAVYCDSGFRASMGASIMQRLGFRQVASLAGSVRAWRAAGLPLERDAES